MGNKMKEKKKKDYGISLEVARAVSEKEKKWEVCVAYMLDLFVFLVLMFCMTECFLKGYGILYEKKLFYGVMLLYGTCFFIAFSVRKWGGIGVLSLMVLYGGASIHFRAKIAAGLASVINKIIEMAAEYYYFSPWKYETNKDGEALNATLFLLFVFLIIIGIEAFCYAKKCNVYLTLLLPILFVFSPEVVGVVPKAIYFITFVIVALAYIGSDGKQNNRRVLLGRVQTIQLVLGILSLFLVLSVFPKEKYEQTIQGKTLKQVMQNWADTKYNNYIRKNLDKGTVNGGINCGELGRVNGISYTGAERLRVELGKDVKTEGVVYLRGYIGSQYGKNQWSPLSGELKKEKKRLEKNNSTALENYGTESEFEVGRWACMTGDERTHHWEELENCATKISSKKKWKQFMKMPYTSDILSNITENKETGTGMAGTYRIQNVSETVSTIFSPYDTMENLYEDGKLKQNKLRDVAKYSFSVINHESDSLPEARDWEDCYNVAKGIKEEFNLDILDYKSGMNLEQGLTQDDSNDYAQYGGLNDLSLIVLKNMYRFYLKQQDYESFVKRAYCQVPKDLRKQLNALISEEGMEDEQNIDTITSFIQYYLTENTNYTLNPGVVPKNKDLVSYFLFESQKGYCVYYASAATMLFRCMGIPARYVEGYVLNTDNAEYVRNTETGKLYTLTDNDAHAWVEIYRSGYGWVPIEVTKGRVVIEENDFEEEMPDDEEEDLLDNTTEPTKTMEPQTSQDTQKEKNGNIENQEKVSTFDWEKARVVLVPIGEIFFVLLFLYIRKCLLWWYRAKQQERANENEKTKLYYKKIMRILQLMKKSSKKEELRDLIKEKDFCTEPIMEQRFHTIVQIMNHYAYSKDGVEEQEVQFIKESYEILRQEFYLQKNWLQKLYYQYILVL